MCCFLIERVRRMLHSLQHLIGFDLQATDEALGSVDDFFFDDVHWTVRYIVVDTGHWLSERLVLISPVAVHAIDRENKSLRVTLTAQQVEDSPPIDVNKPIERHREHKLVSHFAWPAYWADDLPTGRGFSEAASLGSTQPTETEGAEAVLGPQHGIDPHLRSVRGVTGYQIHTTDGNVGFIEDILVDVETWKIRYVVVDTRRFLPGKRVLIAAQWINDVDWSARSIGVDVREQLVKDAPEYDPDQPVDRAFEQRLHAHYGR